MRFVFILYSILLASVAAVAGELDSVRSEQRGGLLYVIHQVEEEETLYSLARRYRSTVKQIISDNEIQDNRIEIGQLLEILLASNNMTSVSEVIVKEDSATVATGHHLVGKGETLYSISKKYDIRIKEIKKWNDLQENHLTPGMILRVEKDATESSSDEAGEDDEENEEVVEILTIDSLTGVASDPFEGFESYLVQTGETLYTIAGKIGVKMDSLRLWNDLSSDYLKIGQKLRFKQSDSLTNVEISKVASGRSNKTLIDENGFEKIFEEGLAAVIESMETTRFLALHRTLPIGTNLEIRNLMNNQVVHVKVVGKLPDTGVNKNLMLRLSKPAYNQLGILDSKSRVEVSYFKK